MDEDAWEVFEPIYEEFSDGKITQGEQLLKIKNKIEDLGYRYLGGNYEPKYGSPERIDALKSQEPLWDDVQKFLTEGDSIVYFQGMGSHGTFLSCKEGDDPTIKTYDLVVGKYYDGEYDYGDDFTLTDNSEALDYLGLEMREEMDDVAGEQTYVEKPMVKEGGFNDMKMWFSNTVFIPQPYNMRWPEWLMKALRAGMNAKMTALHP